MDRVAIATSLFSFATAAAGLFLQITSPSTAQPIDPAIYLAADMTPGLYGTGVESRHAPQRRDLCEDFEARLAAALAFAKVKLALTRAQEPAWSKFTSALSVGAEPLRRECAGSAGAAAPATVPDTLRRFERRATAALEVVHALRPATETLYGQLTQTQQETVDELVQRLP